MAKPAPLFPNLWECLPRSGARRRNVAIRFVHGMWHGAWCWRKMARYLAARGFAC